RVHWWIGWNSGRPELPGSTRPGASCGSTSFGGLTRRRQRARSAAGFTPAERRGGPGGCDRAPPRQDSELEAHSELGLALAVGDDLRRRAEVLRGVRVDEPERGVAGEVHVVGDVEHLEQHLEVLRAAEAEHLRKPRVPAQVVRAGERVALEHLARRWIDSANGVADAA